MPTAETPQGTLPSIADEMPLVISIQDNAASVFGDGGVDEIEGEFVALVPALNFQFICTMLPTRQ